MNETTLSRRMAVLLMTAFLSAVMIHPYQLHSLAKIYHEEALQEAWARHLEHRAKAHCRSRSEEQGLWSRLGKQAAAALRLS